MTTTPSAIERLIRRITPPRGDWYGLCAGLTYRTILEAGGAVPDGPYGSAWLAYLATRIESTNAAAAPAGAVHYWDYTDPRGNRYGHCALDVLGGGVALLSATRAADAYWNTGAGIISVADQSAQPRMGRYLGWSRTYGRSNRLSITIPRPAPAVASGAHTITAATKGHEPMLVFIKGRAGVRSGGLYHLAGGRATFLGGGVPKGVPVLADEAQISRLAALYTGDL